MAIIENLRKDLAITKDRILKIEAVMEKADLSDPSRRKVFEDELQKAKSVKKQLEIILAEQEQENAD